MDEGSAFVLDHSTVKPLLKFDDDPEIGRCSQRRAPAAMIYATTSAGRWCRRHGWGHDCVHAKAAGRLGGAFDGASPPLHVPSMSPPALFRIFYQASLRTSRAAGHQIGFETKQDADPATAAYFADAAIVASEALVDIAARPGGKAGLGHVTDVVITQGPRSSVVLQKGVLIITIIANQGVFGRPSSRKIERVAWVR